MDLRLLQSDVAQIIGVCTDSVTYWENGRAVPQIQHMPKIIEFLGYNPVIVDGESFRGRVREYRLRHGLSHKELGRILEVNASTIGSWESGEFLPHKRMKEKVERLLSRNEILQVTNP